MSALKTRYPYAGYVGLIERAALLLADPGYGLKLGASHGVRDHGLLGFLALNSPTLKDALTNIERYVGVTNEGIDGVFERDGQGSPFAFARPMRRSAVCGTIPNRSQPSWSRAPGN